MQIDIQTLGKIVLSDIMAADLMTFGVSFSCCREVCARRARKLRKRGEHVLYVGRTKTGKARYQWSKRIAPWDIYK